MRKIIFGLAVLGLSSTAAFAQTPTTFADVDTDANGELSFVELQVAWPDLTEAEFGTADADGSGGLTAEELNTLQPSAMPATPADPMAPAAPAAPSSTETPEDTTGEEVSTGN